MERTTVKTTMNRRVRGVVKAMFILLLVVLLVGVAALVALLYYSPGTVAPTWRESTGIAEKLFVEIGGVEQGMIIESINTENPVLLVVHGGPGTTEYAHFKNYDVGLEKRFTVCYWEQRGSGFSYHPDIDPATMTLEQLVSDAVQVTNYLRDRFGQDKIYLMGHSWGTYLGVHIVKDRPELYHAYIGVAQVANTVESEKEIYDFMYSSATERNDAEALKELGAWNPDDEATYKQGGYYGMRMKYATKYGGGILRNETSLLPILTQLWSCRAYTITEKVNYGKGSVFSGGTLLHYVLDANLINDIPALDIPVYIFAGKYDYQTTHHQAELYCEALEVPAKYFYTFENSAHSPMFDEPELFMETLISNVLGQENIHGAV